MSFQHALITGATSGIGEALAHLLASKKIALTLVGRNAQKLAELAKTLGAQIVEADLATQEGRQSVIAHIRATAPDLVINNAGFGVYGEAIATETEEQAAILDVNGRAVLELTLEAAKALVNRESQGVVLNVSSVGGEHPMPGGAVYGASKSFVTMVSRALNSELKPKGVHVLVSCPGVVQTDFQNRAAKKRVDLSGEKVMNTTFAAEEIWRQIEKKREKRIFNWRYRVASFFAARFVPVSFVKKLIMKRIQAR